MKLFRINKCNIKFNIVKKLPYFLLLFIYIYVPVVGGVFSAYFLGLLSWMYIVFFRRTIPSWVLRGMGLLAICGSYVSLVGILYSGYVSNTSGAVLYLMLFTMPGALLLSDVLKKQKIGMDGLIEQVAFISLVQSIIAIACFFCDFIKLPLLTLMGYDIYSIELADIIAVRLYGIASGLTYAMPSAQAIIGTIVCAYAIKRKGKGKYLLYVPVIWLSGIINARTAVVIIVVGLVYIFSLKGVFNNTKFLMFAVGGLITVMLGFVFIMKINPDTGKWVRDGIREITVFLLGGDGGYYFTALKSENFLALPSGADFFWGVGVSGKSDVGFVRNIWQGGLVLCFLLYGFYISMIKSITVFTGKEYNHSEARKTGLFCVIVMILLNIKGELCGINEVSNLLILFYICSQSSLMSEKADNRKMIYEKRAS